MPVKSLSLTIPDNPPYDKADSWFESFAGTDLIPAIQACPPNRFWFTRYGAVGQGKHILFRFEIDDLTLIQPHITALQGKFTIGPDGYSDYDFAADIGRGQGSRFLGTNNQHQDANRRGNIVFDFLHASARLFLDSIDGPDPQGYFRLEPETTSGFSIQTSMEQFHHLFCNMTGVPTFITICTHPKFPCHNVMSYEEFKGVKSKDPRWHLIKTLRVGF